MKVTNLKVTNLRTFNHMEFEFNPRFNLIVGVNGVGKTTILDAIRVCASRILPSIAQLRTRAMTFSVDDIRIGSPFMESEVSFEHNRNPFRYVRRQWREQFAADDIENIEKLRREILDSDRLRDRRRNLLRELDESHSVSDTDFFFPSQEELKKTAKTVRNAPNSIFYSTDRSVISDARALDSLAGGGTAAAYAGALMPRPLFLVQFADWMRAQDELAKEMPRAGKHLEVLRLATSLFLPDYENLRPNHDDGSRLLIDKNGITLDVRQLSDGERGQLALVLDLSRRLSQANPTLDNPLRDGEAIVLIDEIDLHLHPKWQRQIVQNLSRAFPGCQFIATTHSPQVVAAVEPEQVLLVTTRGVFKPDRTLGMDSNWILRHLMEADDRPEESAEAIRVVEELIDKGEFEKARTQIAKEKGKGFDLPEWSVLEARMARFEALSE